MVDVNQKLMYKSLQKRVRHLHSVYVRNLICQTSDVSSLQTYFSLHKSRKSPAFYESEVVGATLNPSWESFDLTGLDLDPACVSSNHVIIRVWCRVRERPTAVVHVLWDVDLRALVHLGDKVDEACAADTPNALVLGLWSGYFGAPAAGAAAASSAPAAAMAASPAGATLSAANPVPSALATAGGGSSGSGRSLESAGAGSAAAKPWRMPDETSSRKLSYSASLLTRLQTVLRALKQTRASVDRIRKSIHDKLRSTEARTSKSSEIEAMELRCRKLRLRVAHERQCALERRKALLTLDLANEAFGQNAIGQKSELVRSEVERVDALRTRLRSDRSRLRSTLLLVDARSRELAAELSYIYPIEKIADDKFTIGGVCLPNSEDFQGHGDAELAVGLGCAAHVVQALSRFLDVPLQFPLACRGSRSLVVDHIIDRPSLRDGEFPLFSKGKDKVAYRYAVFLLNKNVAQLRCALGMPTSDLRMTLPHLHSFLRSKLGVPTTWQEPLTKPIAVRAANLLHEEEVETGSRALGSDRSKVKAGGSSEVDRAGVDIIAASHRSSSPPPAAALSGSCSTDDGSGGGISSDHGQRAFSYGNHILQNGADDQRRDAAARRQGPASAAPTDARSDGVSEECDEAAPQLPPAAEAAATASAADELLSIAGHVRRSSSSGQERMRHSTCRHAVLLLEDEDGEASDDGGSPCVATACAPLSPPRVPASKSGGGEGAGLASAAVYSQAIS